MDQVNERGTWVTTVAFTDEDGNAVVPASASYRIDDVGSDTEVRGDTAISALASSVEILWTAADTSILDETKPYETRRMTVTWTYATATSPSVTGNGSEEYLLNVTNLKGVTTPSPA